jgi:thiamine pyrophosphate-dependent acetolactate synthase large subunit-like protein
MSTHAMGSGLDRREAVQVLLAERGEMLVVSGLGAASYDVFAAGDHDGNFYLWGAMGGAALVGLGVALAQPHRPVTVITGDGEQLMGLGGLATIKVTGVRNLAVVVLDNGHFGETGGQISHCGLGVDLAAVASAIGFANSHDIDSLEALRRVRTSLGDVLGGPTFVKIRVANEDKPRVLPARDGSFLKSRFRAHLGNPVR